MTIFQKPNLPLSLALVAALVNLAAKDPVHAFITAIFYMSLTIWAYLEAFSGKGWFRRLLGCAFLVYIFVAQGMRFAR